MRPCEHERACEQTPSHSSRSFHSRCQWPSVLVFVLRTAIGLGAACVNLIDIAIFCILDSASIFTNTFARFIHMRFQLFSYCSRVSNKQQKDFAMLAVCVRINCNLNLSYITMLCVFASFTEPQCTILCFFCFRIFTIQTPVDALVEEDGW